MFYSKTEAMPLDFFGQVLRLTGFKGFGSAPLSANAEVRPFTDYFSGSFYDGALEKNDFLTGASSL